jgi:carbonic anhydrase
MGYTDRLAKSAGWRQFGFLKGALPAKPLLPVAIVTCMDARIDPQSLFRLNEGDAHVIRNAGGTVTQDVLRSLMISQRMLGTREVMLVHHTECAMLSLLDDEVAAEIEAEVGSRPPFALGGFTDLEEDLRRSMAFVAVSPYLLTVESVRGFIYDVKTGRLTEIVPPP